jgi:hypothetical protein
MPRGPPLEDARAQHVWSRKCFVDFVDPDEILRYFEEVGAKREASVVSDTFKLAVNSLREPSNEVCGLATRFALLIEEDLIEPEVEVFDEDFNIFFDSFSSETINSRSTQKSW